MRILVLGVGNVLLSDEALGIRIVEAFETRYCLPEEVEVLDGGTSGMELMEAMANRDHLIVADAVITGEVPGSITVLHDDEIPAFFSRKVSPHQLGLSDVLMALKLTGEFPRRLTLVGVVPFSLAPGIGLTPLIAGTITPALEHVVAALAENNVMVFQKEEAVHAR